MRYTALAPIALAIVLHSHANAELISGQASGITPAVPLNGIQAGKPFLFTFTIDTNALATSPTASHGRGPVARDVGRPVNMELFIDGHDHLSGELGELSALAGPGSGGRGGGLEVLAEDSLVGGWLLGPNELFWVSFSVPGLIADPVPDYPLTAITLAGITGVTFGFADADEIDPIPVLLANNIPVSAIPEPSTYLLGALAVVGLIGFRRQLGVRAR